MVTVWLFRCLRGLGSHTRLKLWSPVLCLTPPQAAIFDVWWWWELAAASHGRWPRLHCGLICPDNEAFSATVSLMASVFQRAARHCQNHRLLRLYVPTCRDKLTHTHTHVQAHSCLYTNTLPRHGHTIRQIRRSDCFLNQLETEK